MTRVHSLLRNSALPSALFDTRRLTHDGNLDAWAEVVSEEFLHLRVEPHEAARGPCRATVRLHPLGAMIAAEVECAGLRVHRDLDAIAQDRSEVFFAILHLAGDQSTIRQDEEWRPMTPGSIALIDPNRPFAVSLPGPFRYLVIAISAQAHRVSRAGSAPPRRRGRDRGASHDTPRRLHHPRCAGPGSQPARRQIGRTWLRDRRTARARLRRIAAGPLRRRQALE